MAENPQGGRNRVGGGVKSPQGANNPGVAKDPRGDETPGGPTSTEVGTGEDGRGRGGEEKKTNPPPEQPGQREPTAAKSGR